MRRIKQKANNAIRHGAAWFTAAGLSGGVFLWMLVEALRLTVK